MELNFAERISKGHEMRHFEDTMIIINTESNHTKMNILEEIKDMRMTSSAERKDAFYRLLPPVDGMKTVNLANVEMVEEI